MPKSSPRSSVSVFLYDAAEEDGWRRNGEQDFSPAEVVDKQCVFYPRLTEKLHCGQPLSRLERYARVLLDSVVMFSVSVYRKMISGRGCWLVGFIFQGRFGKTITEKARIFGYAISVSSAIFSACALFYMYLFFICIILHRLLCLRDGSRAECLLF